jgi:hypothetical protein
MNIPFLSLVDEHYCQLRHEGCDPVYAATVSRNWPLRRDAHLVAAINEASPAIGKRMREIEDETHIAMMADVRSALLDNSDDSHPFEGLQNCVLRSEYS